MGTEPIIALLDTGCNTMVIQDRVADERKLEKRPLDNPYDIDTAGAGQTIRITSLTTQSIQIFNNTSQNYDSIASFHFEIAPIGIPLILGLPFFEAIGTFTCVSVERPHHILFTLDGKAFNCSSLPSKRHAQNPDSFIRKAQTFTIRGAAKGVKREQQKPFQGIATVSTKRFNKQLWHKQYQEAFAIHIRPTTEKKEVETNTSWPKFLDSVLQQFENMLFKEPMSYPPIVARIISILTSFPDQNRSFKPSVLYHKINWANSGSNSITCFQKDGYSTQSPHGAPPWYLPSRKLAESAFAGIIAD
ncbi:hypothetical protein PhCBS80983_g06305 [Powellomyces hirtus]|uniref:Uncharacterized protein n=1 Tax=Powellomyces hirtus TaxID=109895 RepID=A0A507DR97_9FUNG|nr:hypothetical protein PhCBS80983_g06305 [Powellomyces hirtus]